MNEKKHAPPKILIIELDDDTRTILKHNLRSRCLPRTHGARRRRSDRILEFIDYFNRTMSKPFRWKYKGCKNTP